MTPAPDSFRSYLTTWIQNILHQTSYTLPIIFWYDPEEVWRDLISPIAEDVSAEWREVTSHELFVRNQLYNSDNTPQIVWIPHSRDTTTYLKVYELKAAFIFDQTLPQVLLEYGVKPAKISELAESLPAFTKVQFNEPKATWENLVDKEIITDQKILELLSGPANIIADLKTSDLFPVFRRRVTMEYGFSDPDQSTPEVWQLSALGLLLCTEAASLVPSLQDKNRAEIIAQPFETRAIELLHHWMNQISLIPRFEELSVLAEPKTPLQYWASDISTKQGPFASRVLEQRLYEQEILTIQTLKTEEETTAYLRKMLPIYSCHASSFWGKIASNPVRWDFLHSFSEIAAILADNTASYNSWKSGKEAALWFTAGGWKLDQAGESLLKEDPDVPHELLPLRTRLRASYLHQLNQMNRAFSELLSNSQTSELSLPYSGEIIDQELATINKKDPVAIIILDALRYDLGERIAADLNKGEPVSRARVIPARAPLPSITPLGMSYAIPGISEKISVTIPEEQNGYSITIPGNSGNLAIKSNRVLLLQNLLNLKPGQFYSITEILSRSADTITTKDLGKMIILFGDEIDKGGHEDQLELTGADDHLNRYIRTIRMLVNGGYRSILITTDHGFFHWAPENDEIIEKPTGDIRWKSRRAIVGENLTHLTALNLSVSGSALSCMIPRSVNAFETYGGIGFFHGGSTLQEIIIPVITISYPKKGKKIGVVLKQLAQILSLEPLVEIAPGGAVQQNLDGSIDGAYLARSVEIKVLHEKSGAIIFKSKGPVTVEPGGSNVRVMLMRAGDAELPLNTKLKIRVCDAMSEEILDQGDTILSVELDAFW